MYTLVWDGFSSPLSSNGVMVYSKIAFTPKYWSLYHSSIVRLKLYISTVDNLLIMTRKRETSDVFVFHIRYVTPENQSSIFSGPLMIYNYYLLL